MIDETINEYVDRRVVNFILGCGWEPKKTPEDSRHLIKGLKNGKEFTS